MKKTFLLWIILLIFCACSKRQNKKTSVHEKTKIEKETGSDRTLIFEEIKPYEHEKYVSCSKTIVVDTTIGFFHIRYKVVPNDLIIVIDTIKYSDSSLYLDVDYKGRKIVPLKEYRTTDFPDIVPFSQEPEYEMTGLSIDRVTDSTVVFGLGFYIPDSDIGPSAEITVHCDGSITSEEIEVPFGD